MHKKKMPLQRSPSNCYSSQPNLNIRDEEELNVRVNTRKRKNPEKEQFAEFCAEMKNSFREFQSNQEIKYENLLKAIEALTLQNVKLLESNSDIEKMLQQNKVQQDELKKKVNVLELECINTHNKIDILEDQIDHLQRNQLKTVVEIRNVPKLENEDLNDIVMNMMSAVKNEVSKDSFHQVYRSGKANAPINIEFKNLYQKIELLKAVKTYNKGNVNNKLNSNDLGFTTPKMPIYVSEKLTPKTKMLLSSAKKFVTDGLFKYCWISKGVVLLRKDENEPPVRIQKLKDIETLRAGGRSD